MSKRIGGGYNRLMVSRSYKDILLSTLVLGTSFAATIGASVSVFATEPEVDFSVTVNPSLTLALSSNAVNFSIIPTVQGTYNSANFTITSATNNVYGYTLVMGTSNVNLTSSTINLATTEYPTIPTLTETQDGISAAEFEASADSTILNHYGIAIGTGNNFNAMKTTKQVKKTTTHNIGGADNTTITIASKLDLNTVPGTYSTTLNFQITANPLSGGLEEAYQNAGKSKATINDKQYYAMQDMTSTICNSVTVAGDTLEVYDKRDNTIYRIVKAADGRCWMQDNLALNLLDSNVQTTMVNNPSYTNADVDSLTSLFSGNRTNGGNYATAGVSNWTSSYSYSAPLINISNKDVLPTTYNSTDEPLVSTVTSEKWKVGVYYNYCAASAGSYCYGSDTSSSITGSTAVDKANTAIDAEYDICPSGWRMPTGSSYDATNRPDGGEYQALYDAYSGTSGTDEGSQYASFRKSLRLPLSGYFYGGSAGSQGSYGQFWSSTYGNSGGMYVLYLFTSTVSPQVFHGRSIGYSIRCIAR